MQLYEFLSIFYILIETTDSEIMKYNLQNDITVSIYRSLSLVSQIFEQTFSLVYRKLFQLGYHYFKEINFNRNSRVNRNSYKTSKNIPKFASRIRNSPFCTIFILVLIRKDLVTTSCVSKFLHIHKINNYLNGTWLAKVLRDLHNFP